MQPASLVGQLRDLKEIRLRMAQIAFAQVLYFVHQMRCVALVAGNAVAGMFGVFEKLLLLAADVAGEAARGIFRGGALERKQRVFFQRFGDVGIVTVRGLHRIGVRFRGTVAGFTALDVILVGENELRVARLFILDRFFFVAALALFRAGERTGGRVKIRRVACDGWTLRSFGTLLREA